MFSQRLALNRIHQLSKFASIIPEHVFSARTMAIQKKTCLYDFHVQNDGKMVNFAGFSMPVQYKGLSITDSHLHTRRNASIFDVSHMLQTKILGNDREEFFEKLTVSDVKNLAEGQGTLSLFTNEKGGIEDDLIVTKAAEGYLYVVSNAGCLEKDLEYMQKAAKNFRDQGKDVQVEVVKNGLLALQGPKMKDVLQPLIDCQLSELTFMRSVLTRVAGIDCRVTRCGYTGEDGVEISVAENQAAILAEKLLDNPLTRLAGLGARDTLRLEAGLCLYGNDMNGETTPVEAVLAWTIPKRRRLDGKFPGASIINRQLKEGATKKRVGFLSKGPPVREGTVILNEEGTEEIGKITSGCPSPSLKQNVSMGYIMKNHSKIGSKVRFLVRKKFVDGAIVKMPFVPMGYYHGEK
ncbi:DgyrCDS4348 [Dimorphilus gyrociliatus]|uniref:Aminomethyltransferase n=1 Tax=Dimorphilus gyrociliatus TaxID=2664684 RepID=A0A7I8VHA8_9ANNE|nr:DgyrCDS4348 [Dimorphilus gyrociliatus]